MFFLYFSSKKKNIAKKKTLLVKTSKRPLVLTGLPWKCEFCPVLRDTFSFALPKKCKMIDFVKAM